MSLESRVPGISIWSVSIFEITEEEVIKKVTGYFKITVG